MEKHPWCTGTYRKDIKNKGRVSTHYCMLGAFGAANNYDITTRTPDIEQEFSQIFYDRFGITPGLYNDDVATKKERVIAKLRRLIEK